MRYGISFLLFIFQETDDDEKIEGDHIQAIEDDNVKRLLLQGIAIFIPLWKVDIFGTDESLKAANYQVVVLTSAGISGASTLDPYRV